MFYVTENDAKALLLEGREGERQLYNLLRQAARKRGDVVSGGSSIPGEGMPGGASLEAREREEQRAWDRYYAATREAPRA